MGRPGRPKRIEKVKEEEINDKVKPDVKNESLTLTRARRTPKPNPKYMADDIVVSSKQRSRSNSPPAKKSKKNSTRDDDDSDFEEDLKNEHNVGDVKKVLKDTPIAKKKVIVGKTPTSITTPLIAQAKKQFAIRDLTISVRKNDITRKLATPTQPLLQSKKTTAITPVDKNVENESKSIEKRILRKRKPEELERPKGGNSSSVIDDDELSGEMDINEVDEKETPLRVTRQRSVSSLGRKTPLVISTPIPKKQQIDTSSTEITTKTIRQTTKPSVIATPLTTKPAPTSTMITKSLGRAKTPKPISPKLKLNASAPVITINNKAATDFEDDVPTFTIVNINDIMKKAPEITLKKTKGGRTITTADAKVLNKTANDEDSNDAEEDILILRDDSPKKGNTSNQINDLVKNMSSRRKAQHTTILTDDFEAKLKTIATKKSTMVTSTPKASSVASKSTAANVKSTTHTKSFVLNNNNLKNAKSGTSLQINKQKSDSPKKQNNVSNYNKPTDDKSKPAPRILNTMLAKKKMQNPSLIAEFDIDDDETSTSTVQNYKKNVAMAAKENLKTNANYLKTLKRLQPIAPKVDKDVTKPLTTTKTKLEALMESKPRVVIENQDGTRVKKITCFETWYVINIPQTELPIQKPQILISLVQLGNNVKSIQLPSDEWQYKISLMKSMKPKDPKKDELYTGEVQELNIDETEKHKYEPVNIIFRRTNKNPKFEKMPFDRSIIFKNRSYFLTVDGKSVRLIGAPQYLHNLKDVETLIHIINDINLVNPYVEPSTFSL